MTENKDCGFIDYLKSLYNDLQFDEDNCLVKAYEDVKKEYDTLIHGVGLRDYNATGITELKGKDVIDYLHRISTNSVKDLPQSRAAYTLFLTDKGRMIDRTLLFNLGEKQILIGSSQNYKKLYSWINKYIISEDITASEASILYFLFEFYGPQAESFLTLIFGDVINSLKDFEIKPVSYSSTAFFLCKVVNFGVPKYMVLGNIQFKQNFFADLLEQKSVFDLNPIGEDAFNIFRIEKGIPLASSEINDEFNPHEINLINEIDFNKGCYIGQEVIARLDTYQKVQKVLCRLEFKETPLIDQMPFNISDGENEIGILTSFKENPLNSHSTGLALIKKQFAEQSEQLSLVDSSGKKIKFKIKSD